ncbi:MAG: hypothetical protein AB7I59_17165 [Geminicoccaceae bacterium]
MSASRESWRLAWPLILSVPLLGVVDTAVVGHLDSPRYFVIRLFRASAALANMVWLSWFLGLQDPRCPLALMIVTNGINAVLPLGLVAGIMLAASARIFERLRCGAGSLIPIATNCAAIRESETQLI